MKLGLSCLLDKRVDLISGKRVGLVTNKSGVDEQGRWNVDLLLENRRFELTALFSPEHGLDLTASAGQEVASFTQAGLPVFSLYSQTRQPTKDSLKEVDVVVFDLQDVGLRWFTYISTLGLVMEVCQQESKPVIVLDRPNPLNGLVVEGNVLEPGYRSFVGYYPLPIRYGLTMGELATLFNQQIKADLIVVNMEGWQRQMWYDQLGLIWHPPSPNLIDLETALIYEGSCLFEGTNISEGRGTGSPFQLIGSPWIDPSKWLTRLNRADLPGIRFEEASFTPISSKYAQQECFGVRIRLLERAGFSPIELGLTLISLIAHLYPDRFEWVIDSDGRYFFDKLMGTSKVRRQLESGKGVKEIIQSWKKDLVGFMRQREGLLIYD